MSYRRNFQVKLIDFWKKNKKKIFIIILIWLIIIVINQILKNQSKTKFVPSTTYTPHVTVMGKNEEVSKELQEPIENYIKKYFDYCNDGEYEKAYDMISDSCKNAYFPTLEGFTEYVDKIFQGKKKIYNIQSYSIIDNKYTYNLRILDDILANGTSEPFELGGDTYEDGYYYYNEKLIFEEQDGQLKLSIQYIDDSKPNIIVEDDYMVVKILNVVKDYSSETYTVEIDNKTDNYIVISDNAQKNEITMNYDGRERKLKNQIANLYVRPNSFAVRTFTFNNYYDEGRKATALKFNSVRIFNSYDAEKGTTQENLDNAIKLYGLEVKF